HDLLKKLSKPESIRDTMEYLALNESFRWMEETSYNFILHTKKYYSDFEDYFKFSVRDNNWIILKEFEK
ncbi:MAG TPA: hypothetical protein PK122_06900, partial [Candidatus Paceibacterota bacterium]|nr:hypothetical protein [Candidatus Paceibacterota bacterium]